MNARTLFLSPRATATGQALADAARRRAIRVEALREWRVPDEWRAVEGASLYAGPLFGDAVGAELGRLGSSRWKRFAAAAGLPTGAAGFTQDADMVDTADGEYDEDEVDTEDAEDDEAGGR